MKRIKLTCLDLMVVVMLLTAITGCIIGYKDKGYTYIKPAMVTNIHDNEVFCVDDLGDCWSFYTDSKDLRKMDRINLMMSNNNTVNNLYDDIVLDYKRQ